MLYMSSKTQLDIIEQDLNKWRAGKKIHKYRLLSGVAVLPACIFLYGVLNQRTGFFILGIMLALLLLWAFGRKADEPDTWEGRINQHLKSCSPVNEDAFEKLCRKVKEKRAIEPDDVAVWLKDEKEARAFLERQRNERQRYSFTRWLDKREEALTIERNEERK